MNNELKIGGNLAPDRVEIARFLRECVHTGDHQLHSKEPDVGGWAAKWFPRDDVDAAADWAVKQNEQGQNVYWTVNVVRGRHGKKPAKKDIVAARFCHADIDPPKDGGPLDKDAEKTRLLALPCPPSIIVDSGNGLQPLWRLQNAYAKPGEREQVENINRTIEAELGADNCHNIDRVLRLPGTVNWPDTKKRERGRVPVMAKLVHAAGDDDGAGWHLLDQMNGAFPPQAVAPGASGTGDEIQLGEIKLLTPDDLGYGPDSRERKAIDEPDMSDRSKAGVRAACLMAERGATNEQIAGILLNPANKVSAHYLDPAKHADWDNQLRAATRAIDEARQKVVAPIDVSDALAALREKLSRAAGQTPMTDDLDAGARAAACNHEELVDLYRQISSKMPGFRRPLTDGALGLWDAGDDRMPIPRREWLLGNVFCKGVVSALLASGGTGKTALRIAQALALASGRELTGEKVHRRCRVMLVCLEDDANELRRRVRAAMVRHKVRPEEVRGRLSLAAPLGKAGKLMVRHPSTKLPAVSDLYFTLVADIVKLRPDVVMFDPLVKSHALSENDNGEMDQLATLLTGIAAEANIAVDFTHHTSKGTAEAGNADRGRGASSVKDSARLVYTLTPMSTDEAKSLGVAEQERRFYVRVDSGKVNIAPPLAAARWFRLVGVDLENGETGHTVEPWTPTAAQAEVEEAIHQRILNDLDAGPGDGRRYSDAGSAKDRAAWQVVQEHAPTLSDKRCKQFIKELVADGTLRVEEYHYKGRGAPEKGLFVCEDRLATP